MKKQLYILFLIIALLTLTAVNANAYISNKVLKQDIISHNYFDMHYQCEPNDIETYSGAQAVGKVMTMQYGQLNTQFLKNLGIGVEKNISYITLMMHANTFICNYLPNNFKTKARLTALLMFKPERIQLNMEQFVKQNFWVIRHFNENTILKMHANPMFATFLMNISAINRDIFKDILFGKYNKAAKVIKFLPLRQTLIFIYLSGEKYGKHR